ncbi:MAG: [LysW]-lysine hydrolase [Candidatus Undinarchaeales archaeon]|jgi:LysW-gamma-L-lysine carboxypeptidase|nr:[LysW]-lysine hydrolase [Candidatus Undinarchaeales archaeon]MDP7494352.1 [LysW]-lysine hydrolase [Candidatus Undinarchaeales archaeon]
MLIEDMVSIYSPTGSEGELVSFLIEWASAHGFRAYRDEVGNFVAEKGSGTEVLLVGHVDTVPGEIGVRQVGRRLYGRGAVDAKGPLACFLEAAAAVDVGKVRVIGAVDEEGGSRGARHVLDRFDPAFIIVGEPSGWSNVTLGYKGRVTLSYHREQAKVHSSNSAANGHEEAIDFYNELRSYTDGINRGKSLFGQLGMKLVAVNTQDDGFCEHTDMVIDLRLPVDLDATTLQAFVHDIQGDARVTYSRMEAPVRVGKGNRLVTSFMRAIRSNDGKVTFKLKSGTSDMNVLQAYNVPMVTYGPGDATLDHTPDEHLDLDEYERAVSVLTAVLKML